MSKIISASLLPAPTCSRGATHLQELLQSRCHDSLALNKLFHGFSVKLPSISATFFTRVRRRFSLPTFVTKILASCMRLLSALSFSSYAIDNGAKSDSGKESATALSIASCDVRFPLPELICCITGGKEMAGWKAFCSFPTPCCRFVVFHAFKFPSGEVSFIVGLKTDFLRPAPALHHVAEWCTTK